MPRDGAGRAGDAPAGSAGSRRCVGWEQQRSEEPVCFSLAALGRSCGKNSFKQQSWKGKGWAEGRERGREGKRGRRARWGVGRGRGDGARVGRRGRDHAWSTPWPIPGCKRGGAWRHEPSRAGPGTVRLGTPLCIAEPQLTLGKLRHGGCAPCSEPDLGHAPASASSHVFGGPSAELLTQPRVCQRRRPPSRAAASGEKEAGGHGEPNASTLLLPPRGAAAIWRRR